MLAVFFLWLIIGTILDAVTVLPTWMCAILAVVPIVIWYVKSPEDFM